MAGVAATGMRCLSRKAVDLRLLDDGQLNASFIVPSVFDPAVAPAVAAAVRAEAAAGSGPQR
jgi:malate dehydrogenase (oxaloacetate-decarboxylating)